MVQHNNHLFTSQKSLNGIWYWTSHEQDIIKDSSKSQATCIWIWKESHMIYSALLWEISFFYFWPGEPMSAGIFVKISLCSVVTQMTLHKKFHYFKNHMHSACLCSLLMVVCQTKWKMHPFFCFSQNFHFPIILQYTWKLWSDKC